MLPAAAVCELSPTTSVKSRPLSGRVETRKKILFGGHSVGITNAKKSIERQRVADAVNAIASES